MKIFELSQDLDKLKVAFLPIKPEYADRLMEGTKTFEFRRRPFKDDVTHIVVYASSPRKRIVGILKVREIESGSASEIWKKTRVTAGISKSDFFQYFAGAHCAHAIAIEPSETIRFKNQICPKDIEDDFIVPQSFRYVGHSFVASLLGMAKV